MLLVQSKEQITPSQQNPPNHATYTRRRKDHVVQSNPSTNTRQDPPNQTMKQVIECEAKFNPTVLGVLLNVCISL